jgi:hypothetical protein
MTPLLHNSITPADCRMKERRQKPPLEVNQSHVLSKMLAFLQVACEELDI